MKMPYRIGTVISGIGFVIMLIVVSHLWAAIVGLHKHTFRYNVTRIETKWFARGAGKK